MRADVIVVNHRTPQDAYAAAGSADLQRASGCLAEVVVVDVPGPSSVGADLHPERLPEGTKLLRLPTNAGFGNACNAGAASTIGEVVVFLNADVVLDKGSVPKVVDLMKSDPTIGIVGLSLRDSDGQAARCRFNLPHGPGTMLYNMIRHPRMTREDSQAIMLPIAGPHFHEAEWVLGAALAVRRTVFDSIGGFDERFFLYFEEVDLCRRVAGTGFKIGVLGAATATHAHRGSTGQYGDGEMHGHRYRSQRYYFRKHHGVIGWIVATADRRCLSWRR